MKKLKKKVQNTNKYVEALIKNIYKQLKTFQKQMKKHGLLLQQFQELQQWQQVVMLHEQLQTSRSITNAETQAQ